MDGERKSAKLKKNNNILAVLTIAVEPRFADTRLIRTPHYYGQFPLSLGKAHTFFLTRLIRAPLNTEKGHFFLAPSTNSHRMRTPLIWTHLLQLCL